MFTDRARSGLVVFIDANVKRSGGAAYIKRLAFVAGELIHAVLGMAQFGFIDLAVLEVAYGRDGFGLQGIA